MAHILLGAGTGDMPAAYALRELLDPKHQIGQRGRLHSVRAVESLGGAGH